MRRGFSYTVGNFISAPLFVGRRCATCLLCDVEYDSWGEHAAGVSHIARSAICRTYVSPEQHNSMMQQLWKHIRLDFNYIDEVTHKKEDRRRGRLASTMRHLREQGVLCHSIPKLSVNENGDTSFLVTTDLFVNLMLVGEGYARKETLDRVARLMPRLEAVELSSVVRYILSKRRLARLFDELDMQLLLSHGAETRGAEEHQLENQTSEQQRESAPRNGSAAHEVKRLRQDEKAVVVLSCLGDLQMYSRQDRSHSIATKAAAEQLVLNVLGTHVMENVIAELVHAVLQGVVEEGTPVWRAHCSELTDKLFEDTRAASLPLASSLSSPTVTARKGAHQNRAAELVVQYELEAKPTMTLIPPALGRTSWHELMRSSGFEVTVPNPVNKSALFAPVSPRLSATKKK